MDDKKTQSNFLEVLVASVAIILCCAVGAILITQRAEQQRLASVTGQGVVPRRPRPAPFLFPAGGRTLVPQYRLVALYGTPTYPQLGVLGEQPPEAAIARVKDLAAQYQPFTSEHMLPALEIITTIAAAEPTENGDFSRELDPTTLRPWIDAAKQAGVYVVLDLQPGRSDFLTQAKQYESLLREPHVGLALDPEWRLGPTQVPLQQIGSVDIDEVNRTAAWLADLTRAQQLPQKLVVLHQFRLTMLPDRERLDTAHPELALVIQMDGQGTQAAKADTWAAITAGPLAGVEFGWKNFYAKDTPVLDPASTMQHAPIPRYISYQ